MKSFRIAAIAGLGLLAASLAPGVAAAANGYATAGLNQRAGPGVAFPRIAVIPAGAPVTIYGCLAEAPWCDVSYAGTRGWASAYYLQGIYNAHRVAVRTYRERLGIPFVGFSVAVYWGDYYRDRPFYDDFPDWSLWQPPWAGVPPRPYVATTTSSGGVVYSSPDDLAVVETKHPPGYVAPVKAKKKVAAKKLVSKKVAAKKVAPGKKVKAKVVVNPVKKKAKLVGAEKLAPATAGAAGRRTGGDDAREKCPFEDGVRVCKPPKK